MSIIWYSRLYTGKKARKRRRSIIRGIRNGRFQVSAYVITPPSDGHNILDIYPASMLMHPLMADREIRILGIAYGYQEALEVAGAVVQDMYRATGGFCLNEFLER